MWGRPLALPDVRETKMQSTLETTLPTSAAFRAWVQDCLALLGVSASRVASDLGLSRNTLYTFLKEPGRSITLDNAQAVAAHLRALAAEKGQPLPRPGGRAHV
jgi:DNA-binding phage protein